MADVDERPPGPLAQTGVVVTRPANQAAHLSALLEAAGARVFRFPAIAIVPPRDTDRLEAVLDRLPQFQIAVFVSANAVDWGERYLDMFGGLPASLKVAAVGRGTASALQERGLAPDLVPADRYDSEALLALPEFQESAVSGQRVLILRGEGGRELLADTLYARGAEVEYAEVYRRVRPGIDPGKLLEPLAKGEVDVIIVTSGEGLRNLLDMVGEAGEMPTILPRRSSRPLVARCGWQWLWIRAPQAAFRRRKERFDRGGREQVGEHTRDRHFRVW